MHGEEGCIWDGGAQDEGKYMRGYSCVHAEHPKRIQ